MFLVLPTDKLTSLTSDHCLFITVQVYIGLNHAVRVTYWVAELLYRLLLALSMCKHAVLMPYMYVLWAKNV